MDIEHVRSRFIKHFDGTTGFIYASGSYQPDWRTY